jgi:ribosomal protein S18 acetylase RimI-like enzyme
MKRFFSIGDVMIEYRTGKLEDLDEICHLVLAAIAQMDVLGIHQWDELYPAREDFADDIRKEQLQIGIVNDVIAVIFVVNQECDGEYENGFWEYPNDRHCIIHRLCVNPAFQHQGIAKRTIEYAENQIMDNGFQAVRLDVFAENPWAMKLYEGLGYRKVGFADWRKGRFYLMEKHLVNTDN